MKKFLVTIIALLFHVQLIFATFTLAGTTITQTGTDANLSGLSTIAGVTVINTGTKIKYDIGSLRLVINGTLSFSSITEQLITTGNNPTNQFSVNGTLTINGNKTINSVTVPTYGYGIVSTATNLISCCDNGVFTLNNGATFNLLGASIEVGSVMDHKAGSVWNVINGKVVTRRDIATNAVRIRQNGEINANGLITEGISLDLFVVPTALNKFSPKIVAGLHGIELVSTNNARLEDFNPEGSKVDFDNWNNQLLFLRNAVKGTDMIITNSNNNGRTAISKQIDITFKNLSEVNLMGVKTYVKDTDNGSRAAVVGLPSGINPNNDIVYTAVSGANGKSGILEIYTGFSRGGHVLTNQNGQTLDLRGNTNIRGEDLFTFNFASYGHVLGQTTYTLKSAGVLEPIWTLFNDNSITEPSKAVVDAYTGIVIDHTLKKITISENKNLCEVYDFAKANKVDNIQFPTPSTLTVVAQGSNLLFNDYQLEITGAAVLSPCDKFTKVISTVNASLNNPNVNLNVALTDATNTYKLIQIKNIVSANVVVTDENTNTILAQYTNYTGEVNLATQSTSNNVSIVVRRNNYSNWAVNFDLTTADEFLFTVNQSSVVVVSALLSKQDMLIYLLQKVLQKNQAIQSVLNNNTLPTINLNTINQGTVEYASEEKQDEMIEVLKRILAKTQAIRRVTDN